MESGERVSICFYCHRSGGIPDGLDGQCFLTEWWIRLVNRTKHCLDSNGSGMAKSGKCFSQQLFDPEIAPFATYCLRHYAAKEGDWDRPFTCAVNLKFGCRMTG